MKHKKLLRHIQLDGPALENIMVPNVTIGGMVVQMVSPESGGRCSSGPPLDQPMLDVLRRQAPSNAEASFVESTRTTT